MSTSLTTQIYMFKTFGNVNSDTILHFPQKSIAIDWVKMCWERIRMALVAGATPGVSRESRKHQSTNDKARKQQIRTCMLAGRAAGTPGDNLTQLSLTSPP